VREQDSNGNYTYEYDGGATDAIKREIKAGRAVDFCFAFGTEKDQMQYCDETTWAEYAYDVDAAPDHSCCIVGWDDNYSKTNFKSKDAKGNAVSQPPENGAFLVKNSWGASNNKFPNKFNFGNNGYFWLSYYDPTITMCASYDFNGSKAENKKSSGYYAYGYDYMPVMVVNNDTTDDPAYTANVFTASSSQKIRSLSCQTAAAGDTVTYELYKLNKGYTSPEDGTLMYKTTKTYQYAGYHRIDFSKSCFLSAGDKFSVVITEKDTDNKFVLPVNTAMSKAAGQKTYATSVINKGESYVCSSDTNNVWSDWKNAAAEIVEQAGGTMCVDNFAIKAYGDPVTVSKVSGVTAKAQGSSAVKVTWNKVSGTAGYQVAKKKAGGKYAAVNASKSATSKIFKKLAYGKKYSFKVRAYKKISGKTVYGKWSNVKTISVK